jgi:hypothetical protein
MSEVNPNYNPFSDWKEPNEELMKATERYKAEVSDRELGLFLNWFIRHYSTEITTDRGLLYYANAMGEEVSIAEILEHYNREK